jgi:hypothetical protein
MESKTAVASSRLAQAKRLGALLEPAGLPEVEPAQIQERPALPRGN